MAEFSVLKDTDTPVSGDSFGAYGHAATMSPGFSAFDDTFAKENRFSLTAPGNVPLDRVGLQEGQAIWPANAKNTRLSEIAITTRFPGGAPVINKNKGDAKQDWSPKYARLEQDPPWALTYHGRIWMRAISRGIFGALAYGIMGVVMSRTLNTRFEKDDITRVPGKKPGYQGGRPVRNNPLHWIAYGIDMTLGKAIQGLGTVVMRDKDRGREWVVFRRTKNFGYGRGEGSGYQGIRGRSLGHEMVDMTADFAAMSLFDLMARITINRFDPHLRKARETQKENKKNEKPDTRGFAAKVSDGTLGVIKGAGALFLNGPMPDIFAALPYVYFMRFQRHFLNRLSPGFEIDAAAGRWGGSARVKLKDGASRSDRNPYEIVGNYNLEGILDFTGRFTFYNIMTKFYRELYTAAEVKLFDHKHDGVDPLHPQKEKLGIWGRIKGFMKYLLVTSTTVTFYMIPAAFLFGVLRAGQAKHIGLMISEEVDPATQRNGDPATARKGRIIPDEMVEGSDKERGSDYAYGNQMYLHGNKPPFINTVTNPLGKASAVFSGGFIKAYRKILSPVPLTTRAKGVILGTGGDGTEEGRGSVAERHGESAWAYLPYLWLSVDVFSELYDTTRTKFVLNGFYSSVANTMRSLASFNSSRIKTSWNNLKEWTGEVWLSILKQPSARHEAEIRQAMKVDELHRATVEANQLTRGTYLNAGESREAVEKKEMETLKNWLPAPKNGNNSFTPGTVLKNVPSQAQRESMTILKTPTSVNAQDLQAVADRQAMRALQTQNVPTTSLSSVSAGSITPQPGAEPVGAR